MDKETFEGWIPVYWNQIPTDKNLWGWFYYNDDYQRVATMRIKWKHTN